MMNGYRWNNSGGSCNDGRISATSVAVSNVAARMPFTTRRRYSRLAIDGGAPVRQSMLPYGRHFIDEQDVGAVLDTLRSDWLTTGPKVAEFERALAAETGAAEAVALSSGTAALHSAMHALGVGPGDEVIVPAVTFAATANSVLYQGGTPVFADVNPDTLLIDPTSLAAATTPRTKAIIAMDYGGQPCDYEAIQAIADEHGSAVVADSCHALGAKYKHRQIGTLAAMSAFSFHPVKHVAAGEGGAITTNSRELAQKIRTFRNHGITTDHHQRTVRGGHVYEMEELGYNYRLSDLQCALATSQLGKLKESIRRRRAIAARYDASFAAMHGVRPLAVLEYASHAYHLYVVRFDVAHLRVSRDEIFAALRAENIGVNVHYIPVYWHPYYQRLGFRHGLCPDAEAAYERILTLPMFNGMGDSDVDDVVEAVEKVVTAYLV